jgi:hypothetical protein
MDYGNASYPNALLVSWEFSSSYVLFACRAEEADFGDIDIRQ